MYKKPKYRNKIIKVNGNKFDSKKEYERYCELAILQQSGKIKNLQKQVKFEIVPKAGNNKRARFYIADFVYEENGIKIIEDVKSPITKKNPVYSLKKALVLYLYTEYNFIER